MYTLKSKKGLRKQRADQRKAENEARTPGQRESIQAANTSLYMSNTGRNTPAGNAAFDAMCRSINHKPKGKPEN